MVHNHIHTQVSGKKLTWTIIFNLLITIAEFIGGLISGYLALVADAVHNLSDVAALGLAWIGIKGSSRPATKKSTYGFKRLEVMTAFISAVTLVVIAIYILMEAYDRLLNPQPITHPKLFLTVAFIGLAGNILSIVFLHPEKGKSLNLKTAFLHMAYDAASSVAVIIGGIVIILTGWMLLDVLLATVIALMIFWSSYLVIREAVMIFLEAVPAGIDFDTVLKTIEQTSKVKDVHDLHIWSLSSHEIALSCHIHLDENDYKDGPQIIEQINQILFEKYHIGHSTIQIGTGACDYPNVLCRYDSSEEEPS